MSDGTNTAKSLAGAGTTLLAVQFLLAATWTVYVLFLPQLAERAGIAKSAVVAILMLDQILFALGDFAAGALSDKVAQTFRALGRGIAAVSVVSCAAFLLLPQTTNATLLMSLIVAWSLSSSALRAPVFALVAKHAPQPAVPRLAAMSLFGLGVAGAIGPYLTAQLRGIDPAVPFAISSIALALAALALSRVTAFATPDAAAVTAAVTTSPGAPPRIALLSALALAVLAFQVHTAIGSAPAYLRFADKTALEQLLPVFWIGFNLGILPVGFLCKRIGEIRVFVAGALLGAAMAFLVGQAGSLQMLVAVQFFAGMAWACVALAAFSAAIELGRTGFEGRMLGLLFGLFALATLTRIAAVAAQLPKDPAYAAAIANMPWLLWGAAALLLLFSRGLFQRRLAPAQ